MQLVNGTDAFDLWRKPNVPIYLQVWVFHLQNAEVVSNGGKPDVVERGPYTYREVREKVDLCYHDNGTVTYRQIKTYHFVREKSIGWDNDTFTSINIPYMVSWSMWFKEDKQCQRMPAIYIMSIPGIVLLLITQLEREIYWYHIYCTCV